MGMGALHARTLHAQARVEYWVAQYLRTPGELFYSSGAFPLAPRTPLLLALHHSWRAIHPRWNVFALERALLSPAEARDLERWWPAGGRPPAEQWPLPRWLLTADPLGHILHFSSVRNPWDLAALACAGTGPMCASPTTHPEASSLASAGATPALQPCALAWNEAAREGASQLEGLGKDGRKRGLGGSTSRSGGSSSAAEGRGRAKEGREGTKGGASGGRDAKPAPSAERVSASSKAKGAESKDSADEEPASALHGSCGSEGCSKGKGKRQGKAKDSAKPGASAKASSGGKASPRAKGAVGKLKDKARSAKGAGGEDGDDEEDGEGGEGGDGGDGGDGDDGGEDGEGDPNPLFADGQSQQAGRAGKKSKHAQKDDDDTDARKSRKAAALAAVKSSKTGAKRTSSKTSFWADK